MEGSISSLVNIIILLLVLLNLVLVFIYYLEYRRNQKLLGISKRFTDSEKLYKKSQESANQLLNQTINESEIIIDRAYREATQIVNQMKKTAEKIDSKTEAEMGALVAEGKVNLQKQIDNFAAEFRHSLDNLGKDEVNQVQKIQAQVYQEVLVNMNSLIANLKNQAIQVQDQVGLKADEQLKNLNSELEVYKKQQIERLNANLYEILLKAARTVLGEGISLSVQKETVLKAIDEAKREGMIA